MDFPMIPKLCSWVIPFRNYRCDCVEILLKKTGFEKRLDPLTHWKNNSHRVFSMRSASHRSQQQLLHNNYNNNTEDYICRAHISTLLFAQGANPETPAQTFSFTISVLGSFTCVTHAQHKGPTALRPIRKTKQLWLSVLLKDTSACDRPGRDSNPHSLTTPELESNARDRSATTQKGWHWNGPDIHFCTTIYMLYINIFIYFRIMKPWNPPLKLRLTNRRTCTA